MASVNTLIAIGINRPEQDEPSITTEEDWAPVPTRLAIWNIPRPVVAKQRFQIQAGLSSVKSLPLNGAMLAACDEHGQCVGRAAVSPDALPGTTATFGATLDLIAPATPGEWLWRVQSNVTAVELPHADTFVDLPIMVVPAPTRTLVINAVDISSGAGVPGVLLRLGPFTGQTTEEGHAEFRIPPGNYCLRSWHPDFDCVSIHVDVDSDAIRHLELHRVADVEREYL